MITKNHYISHKTVLLLLLLLLAFVLLMQRKGFLYIDNYMNNDIIVSAYNANLLSYGLTPYVDSYEVEKPPLTFFLFYFIFKLFGDSAIVVRITGLFFTLVSAFILFLIGKQLFNRSTGTIASLLYALFSHTIDYGDVHYTTFMLPFYLLALYCFLVMCEKRKSLFAFLTGLFFMSAFLIKPSSAVLIPLFVLLLLFYRPPLTLYTKLHALTMIFLGSFISLLPFILFFFYKDALMPFLKTTFFSPWFSDYLNVYSLKEASLNFFKGIAYIARLHPITFWFMIGGIVQLIRFWRSHRSKPAFLFLFFSFAGAALPLRFYVHHIVQFFPAQCLFAGFFLYSVFKKRDARSLLLLLGILIIFKFSSFNNEKEWFKENLNGIAYRQYHALYNRAPHKMIGSIINKRSNPDDTIYCWDYDAWDIYCYAGRRSASRVYKVIAGIDIMHTNTGWGKGPLKKLTDKEPLKKQLTDDIRNNKPKFIVIGSHGKYISTTPCNGLGTVPALKELIDTEYRLIGQSWTLLFYARKDLLPEGYHAAPLSQKEMHPFLLYFFADNDEYGYLKKVSNRH